MTALRASYSIAPEILQRFNALVPSSERSKTVQSLMESILERREKNLEALAHEFATHPDFARARADGLLWDATAMDGLSGSNSKSFVNATAKRRQYKRTAGEADKVHG